MAGGWHRLCQCVRQGGTGSASASGRVTSHRVASTNGLPHIGTFTVYSWVPSLDKSFGGTGGASGTRRSAGFSGVPSPRPSPGGRGRLLVKSLPAGAFLTDNLGDPLGRVLGRDHLRRGLPAPLELQLALLQTALADHYAERDADQVGVLELEARPAGGTCQCVFPFALAALQRRRRPPAPPRMFARRRLTPNPLPEGEGTACKIAEVPVIDRFRLAGSRRRALPDIYRRRWPTGSCRSSPGPN